MTHPVSAKSASRNVELRDVLAVMAIIVSLLSFVGNLAFNVVKARFDRRPLLTSTDNGRVWELRNVGNGPALDVVVQQKYVRGPRAGAWFDPVRVPDMGKDQARELHWLGRVSDVGLGATYKDSSGHLYATRCGADRDVTARLSRCRRRPAELSGLNPPLNGHLVTPHWDR